MNDALEGARREILEVIKRSEVPEDFPHANNTCKWLLRLNPTADQSLQIAALAHDIDRAATDRKARRADYPDYDAFKKAHAENSVTILREILTGCGKRYRYSCHRLFRWDFHAKGGGFSVCLPMVCPHNEGRWSRTALVGRISALKLSLRAASVAY